jgi:hypothetical protein
MPEFDDRERTLILMALWNYKLQAGQVKRPDGRGRGGAGRQRAGPGRDR